MAQKIDFFLFFLRTGFSALKIPYARVSTPKTFPKPKTKVQHSTIIAAILQCQLQWHYHKLANRSNR